MRFLALLLLAPWLLILGWAYLSFPRELGRGGGRRLFDVVAMLLAVAATGAAVLAGFEAVPLPATTEYGRASGAIWKQVLPALYGYGAWVVVLVPALLVRQYCWSPRRPGSRAG
jgi:hypothetical protein